MSTAKVSLFIVDNKRETKKTIGELKYQKQKEKTLYKNLQMQENFWIEETILVKICQTKQKLLKKQMI